MDNVKSGELGEEGLDLFGPPATVIVDVVFKNGTSKQISFSVPVETPIYHEPLTASTVYDVISTAYSFGETPFLALPDVDGSYTYIDLGSTSYTNVKVVEHE